MWPLLYRAASSTPGYWRICLAMMPRAEPEEQGIHCKEGRIADGSYNELCSLKIRSSDVSAPRRASICISVSVLVLWASGSICARRRAFSVLKRSFSALKIATFSAAIRACARASSRSYSRIRARSRQIRAAAVSAASFTALLGTGRNPRGSATFFTPSLVSDSCSRSRATG